MQAVSAASIGSVRLWPHKRYPKARPERRPAEGQPSPARGKAQASGREQAPLGLTL